MRHLLVTGERHEMNIQIIPEQLTIGQRFELVKIAHETPYHNVRRWALDTLARDAPLAAPVIGPHAPESDAIAEAIEKKHGGI